MNGEKREKVKIKNGQTLCFPIPITDEKIVEEIRKTLGFVQEQSDEYLKLAHENKLYDVLEDNKKKYAYKILEPVFKTLRKDKTYIPSRINRGILEIVGRTLRSLKARKDLFELLQSYDTDPKKWNRQYLIKHKLDVSLEYVKNIREQTINYKRKHKKLPQDFYELQKEAKIKTQILTYAPDDQQAMELSLGL